MHWAYKIANEIIEKRPNEKVYTMASGITPSGSIHIGNYREFITQYYVGKALKEMGKNVRMIFSWDDFDRFRKVPKNVDIPGFDKYLGMPVSDVPNPFAESGAESFARHWQQEFEKCMEEFGNNEIPMEFVYQNKKYKSGIYNDAIIEAIQKRKQIYDIITSFKTQEESDEEREGYFPVSVYCKECGKDFNTAIAFCEKSNDLTYVCKCDGAERKVNVKTADNVKLVWKVDWPMRWRHENVAFEAAGIDHHSENGSFAVSRRISREIFNHPEPETVVYAWVGIKGVSTANMSSSSGINITPRALLEVYEPEIIRWLYAKYDHAQSFDFGFDDIVSRHYIEFDRAMKNYISDENIQDYERAYMKLALFNKPQLNTPFQTIGTLAAICNFDMEKTRALVKKMGMDVTKGFEARFKKATAWLKKYMPDKIYTPLKSFNKDFHASLSEEERTVVSKLSAFLSAKGRTEEEIQKHLYEIINDPSLPKKENIARQQRFFKIFYNLLFGKDEGPRLYLYLAAADLKETLSLLAE